MRAIRTVCCHGDKIAYSERCGALASISARNIDVGFGPLSREQSIREAVVLSFCDPLPDKCMQLASLSSQEWLKLLEWLDISGLALYFLDRVVELQTQSSTAIFSHRATTSELGR